MRAWQKVFQALLEYGRNAWPKQVIKVVVIGLLDFLVLIIISFSLLNYEANWQPGDGPFYTLGNMKFHEQLLMIAYLGWYVVNMGIIAYLGYRLWQFLKQRLASSR